MRFSTTEAEAPTVVELRDCGNGVVMIAARKGDTKQDIAQLSDGVLTLWTLNPDRAASLGIATDNGSFIRVIT